MTQFDFGALMTSDSGSTLVAKLSGLVPALMTQHSGVARPGYVQPGMLWVDTSGSVWKLNLFDGTSDVVLFTVDPASHARAVSGYAPLASPTFTGDPKAPTPAAGDNDTSLATTAFVQGERGFIYNTISLSADATLDASYFGLITRLNSTTPITVTLPAVATSNNRILHLVNGGASAAATHTIATPDGGMRIGGILRSSFSLRPGQALTLVGDGTRWLEIGQLAALLDTAVWTEGTSTDEASISPAKLAATIAALATSSGLRNVQVFTASGTYYPTSGTSKAIVFVTGGGGGGGYGTGTSNSGGGAGATAMTLFINPGNAAVTVGAGGSKGASGANTRGATGGSSSLGAMIASGGTGGQSGANSSTPGSAGSGGASLVNAFLGMSGGQGVLGLGSVNGAGGASFWGGGPGAGGIGDAAGSAGCVVVLEF